MHIFPTKVGYFFRTHRVFISFLIPALILLIALPLTIYLLSRPTGLHIHAQQDAQLPTTVYYGTWTNNSNSGAVSLSQFESDAGKNVAIDHVAYVGWTNFFPQTQVETAREHGSIPMVTWMSGSYTLSEITSGSLDSYITSFAQAAKAWGHPFFLRFDHELNGNWYGWSENANGNKVGEFVPMWRHVHDIFTTVGATNVTWVWCPSHGSGEFDTLYPGDAYVDWTCLDGYNKYDPANGNANWNSFSQIFTNSYTDITTHLAPAKPLMIGEYSSTEDPQTPTRKASWFTDALTTQLPTNFPLIKGLVFFNVFNPQNQPFDYRIESSTNAQQAFRQAIASTYYATNTYGAIDCSNGFCPIPPPKDVTNGSTPISVTICPHDIGKCGDNTNPTGQGNTSVKHQSRLATITFYNGVNTPVVLKGTVMYAPSTQNFQGSFTATNLLSGPYAVKVQMTGYLIKQIDGIVTVTQGQQVTLPQATLVTADINNDNKLDVLDYNALISCYGAKVTTSTCLFPITSQSTGADINDDGVVDGIDYNIFIREIANQSGTGGPTPTISPPVSPTLTPTPVGCQPNAILVNPCKSYLGAAAHGNPEAANDPISQFTFLESLIGHQLDIYHEYNRPPAVPLSNPALHFATRPNTYVYINWKPVNNWGDAGGGNSSVNAAIDKAAANIKAIAPHKIFLTIWHEPENDVTPGTSSCPGLKGSAGSPTQYRAMWQNVRNRFNAAGVNNVVWVMNYMNYKPWSCLIPELWPGNTLVDWVTFEAYVHGATDTFQSKISDMYNLLQKDNDSTHDFVSKPWGIGEFGDCNDTDQQLVYQHYQEFTSLLDKKTFPRLKLYMVYSDTGNNAGPGCLTNYTVAGTLDPTEQVYFNQIANDSIFQSK